VINDAFVVASENVSGEGTLGLEGLTVRISGTFGDRTYVRYIHIYS